MNCLTVENRENGAWDDICEEQLFIYSDIAAGHGIYIYSSNPKVIEDIENNMLDDYLSLI